MAHEPALKYEIVTRRRQTAFLNLYSTIERDRLEVEVIGYDPATGRHQERAAAYLDITAVRLLVHQVLSGAATRPGWTFEERGGSVRPGGELESRLINIAFDPAGQRFLDNPFRISLETGPGTRTTTGGIGPAATGHGPSIRFEVAAFIGICLEIAAYLTAHQREIEAHRYREQLARYHSRRNRTDTNP